MLLIAHGMMLVILLLALCYAGARSRLFTTWFIFHFAFTGGWV